FKAVIGDLGSMDDKVKQNQIGVGLFATRWEDMGAKAVLGLTDVNGGLGDVLPKAAKGISDLAEWFSKLPGPVKDFVAISAGLTIAITAIGAAIGVLSFAFGALSLSLWPVLGIILGLSAVITGSIIYL
ncbi:hypothetical protein ACUN90_18240, partial [Escherichia sp. SP-MK2]